ncbi:MAG: hypothetical protein A3E83_01880 [Gammaproteobacteria bacterium RIFCSPHIGHO2_12_FULL_41_20]|nr:MAG: hypothetical protein A3E83_01880 [Gammaproteobacteria bacterium RIFCSPHIGHO2_12_FULL_41_20]
MGISGTTFATSGKVKGFSTTDIMVQLAQRKFGAQNLPRDDRTLITLIVNDAKMASAGEVLARESSLPSLEGAINTGIDTLKKSTTEKKKAAAEFATQYSNLHPDCERIMEEWQTLRAKYQTLLEQQANQASELIRQALSKQATHIDSLQTLRAATDEMQKSVASLHSRTIALENKAGRLYHNVYTTADVLHQQQLLSPAQARETPGAHLG